MRRYCFSIVPFLIAIGLSSCNEPYRNIDPANFNREIANRQNLNTPKDLIKAYCNWPEEEREGNQSMRINWKGVNGQVEITLIHEGLQDDSQQGMKVVMIAEETGKGWNVLEIRESWKCWAGRGYTDWGTDLCN